MTRLLIPTDNHPPRWDGISRFLTEVVPRLNDYQVTIISPDYGKAEIDGAEHIKLPVTSYTVGDYDIPRPKLGAIKDAVKRADLVFGQTIGPIGSTAGHYARRTKTDLIHYTHTVEWQLIPEATNNHSLKRLLQGITRQYAKWYYNSADELITPSRTIKETLHYEGIKTKTAVVPLGVNHDDFKPVSELPADEQSKVKAIHEDYADNTVLIGYHGRLAREKNLVTLLRAVKRLRKQRDDFRVLIIGDGLDDIREKFEDDPTCDTLPAQDDVHRYVQALDIYVSTSLTETTSLSTAEAMACGKPVIATPAGYIEDYVEHGENGLIFDYEDNYELSHHLNDLLNDADERQRLGENAHRTARETFNWENTADEIQDVLDAHR